MGGSLRGSCVMKEKNMFGSESFAGHVVLLGDSIFDNKSYVGDAPDVVGHLRSMLPSGGKATLCAIDGSTTGEIPYQVERVPQSATHLFVSVGGNDVLMYEHLLSDDARSGPALLRELSRIAEDFYERYAAAIGSVCALQKPTCVCTIYNGDLEPNLATAAKAAVAVFNDKIYSVASEKHISVIELRNICKQPEDYANPIEPSGLGGKKIARAIADHIQ